MTSEEYSGLINKYIQVELEISYNSYDSEVPCLKMIRYQWMNNIIVNQTFGETETTCNWIYSTIEMSISIEYIATIKIIKIS